MSEGLPKQEEGSVQPELTQDRPVVSYEKTERSESHREIAYHLPEEVAEDMGHPTTRKGWISYWKNRLESKLTRNEYADLWNDNHALIMRVNREVEDAHYVGRRTAVMQRLAAQLAEIDERIEYPENELALRKEVYFDENTGAHYVINESGESFPFQFHDVGPDLEWGVAYRPSSELSHEDWRKIRKRSAIAEARMAIDSVDNEELAKNERISLPTTTISGDWIEKSFNRGNNTGLHGVIGERMAKNALLRISKAQPEMDMRVENSNALEDAELKYDFKVKVNVHHRGIATEPEDFNREDYVAQKRMLGIQFTVGKGLGKENQIAIAKTQLGDERMHGKIKHEVDDIILVKLNLDARKRYQRWLDDGKPPGGPERYMDKAEIANLITLVSNEKLTR